MGTQSAVFPHSENIQVCPATLRDLLALYRLERRCFPLDSWPLIDILAALLTPRIVQLKAMDGVRLIGFVMGDQAQDAGWVATIGVDPDFRRRGIGSTLLEAIEGAMQTTTYRLCVRQSNTTAIRLYQRYGYEMVDTWKRYYRGGEDALVMEKTRAGRLKSAAGL